MYLKIVYNMDLFVMFAGLEELSSPECFQSCACDPRQDDCPNVT